MPLTRTLLCLALLLPPGGLAANFELVHNGQRVPLAMTPLLTGSKQASLQRWMQVNALALAQVYGRWPHQDWVAEVTPVALFTDDPVPFARVMRGEPDRVEFYISLTAGEERLVNDWTAYHKFNHLLIPYRGWGDMWFRKGLASYYQNILRRRIGILDERTMWQKLY